MGSPVDLWLAPEVSLVNPLPGCHLLIRRRPWIRQLFKPVIKLLIMTAKILRRPVMSHTLPNLPLPSPPKLLLLLHPLIQPEAPEGSLVRATHARELLLPGPTQSTAA